MATATTAPITTHSSSPFINLPIEIRLAIYRFALENTLDHVESSSSVYGLALKDTLSRAESSTLHKRNGKSDIPRLPYLGALALLHTKKSIRGESAREMLPIVEDERKMCASRRECLEISIEDCSSSAWHEYTTSITQIVVAEEILGTLMMQVERGGLIMQGSMITRLRRSWGL